MPPITMYCTAVCPYCSMAEKLLIKKGVTEINKVRVDLDASLMQEMMQMTGRRTVPQIYIGERHIGGFDDISALDASGGLDPLLAA